MTKSHEVTYPFQYGNVKRVILIVLIITIIIIIVITIIIVPIIIRKSMKDICQTEGGSKTYYDQTLLLLPFLK